MYLLLSLYTYQPPLRMDYNDMAIVKTVPKNKKLNYIWDNNGKYKIIIRNDKVIKSHGPLILDLNDTLNNIINDSLNSFPRDYILSTQNDGSKPLNKQGFESLLYYCFPDKKWC